MVLKTIGQKGCRNACVISVWVMLLVVDLIKDMGMKIKKIDLDENLRR